MYELYRQQNEIVMKVHQIKVIIIDIIFRKKNFYYYLYLGVTSDERHDQSMAIICCLYLFFVAYLTFTNYETYDINK